MNDAGKKIIKRFNALKSSRSRMDDIYSRVAAYAWPTCDDFYEKTYPHEARNRAIFNSLPEHLVEIFASSMAGVLANPATKWLGAEFLEEEKNREASFMDALETGAQTLLNYVNRPESQFYSMLKTSLINTAVTGTPIAECREIPGAEGGGFQFVPLNIANVFFAENPYGMVDTVFEEKEYTNEQLLTLQDDDDWSLPDDVVRASPDAKRKVVRGVFPRNKRNTESKAAKDKPVACLYVDRKSGKILKETGYDEMSIAVGRWEQMPRSQYSTSPAVKAFSDILSLQYFTKILGMASEKNVDPSVWMPQGFTKEYPDFSPAAVNYYDADKGGLTFQTATGDLNVVASFISEIENRLRMAFFADQLQMAGSPQMTAYEVAQRLDQQFRLLAPSLGRMQTEFMAPLLQRAYNILVRQGKIKNPPLMQGSEFRISFTTPLTRAQRSGDAQNIMMLYQELGAVAQLHPEVLDVISPDKVAEEMLDIRGVMGLMARERGDDEEELTVAEIRQQRAEQQEAATAMAAAGEMANTGKTMAEADAIQSSNPVQ